MAKVIGKNFAVYVDGDKVGDARDCTLNVSQALIDATSKDDANWMTRLASMREWSIDVEALFDETNTVDAVDLVDLILNATQVQVEFSQGTTGTSYWYGNAYVTTANVNAPNADITSASVTFQGDGTLTKGSITGS